MTDFERHAVNDSETYETDMVRNARAMGRVIRETLELRRQKYIIDILEKNDGEMNLGDLLDEIKYHRSASEVGLSLSSVFAMLSTRQVMITEDNDAGRLVIHRYASS